MSKKSEMAAMYYLVKVKPKEYRMRHFGCFVQISQLILYTAAMIPYSMWEEVHRVQLSSPKKGAPDDWRYEGSSI